MGRIFSDYSKIDFSSPQGRAKALAAVQYFATERVKVEAKKHQKAMQALTTSGDFPTRANEILEKFHALPYYDTGYEQIFAMKDFTQTNESGYDIVNIEDGLTFNKVAEGGKAKIYKMAGTKTSVTFDLYGGGLGWHRTLIDDKKYWTLEDNAVAFVNKAAEDKASNFYALVEALATPTYDVAWQAAEPSTLANTDATYTANRDAQTLNAAAQAILIAVKDSGYGVTFQNANFIVSCPVQLVGRLNRAMGVLLQGFSGSPGYVNYRFTIVPTTMYSSSTSYYVILPKINLIGVTRMNLTVFDKFDIESYSDIAVGWQRYGGAIGDSNQLRRCATS